MQIMVCDDEQKELEKLTALLKNYALEHPDLPLEVKSYQKPFAMLDDVTKRGAPDIALLDICMPGILGTDVARELQGQNSADTDVIFLTSSADYALDAFSLHASDYLQKPYTSQRLAEALDKIAARRQKRHYTVVQLKNEAVRIDLYSMEYATVKEGEVLLCLHTGKVLKTRSTLMHFAEQFAPLDGFALVGASYLVNFRYVKSMYPESMLIDCGQEIPIPRRLRNSIRQQYFQFYKQEAILQNNL